MRRFSLIRALGPGPTSAGRLTQWGLPGAPESLGETDGPGYLSTNADFEAIADELYALRPDEFAAARDERIKAARAEKNQALARELAGLRKPTQSAWLINLLWRDQREVIEQLFELADELTRAQAGAAGGELRSLTAQRRELESALLRRAQALAEQAGVTVTDTVVREAQETLGAALANPDIAGEVRSGRLVKPASYAGFGVLPSTISPPRAAAATRAAKTEAPAERTHKVRVEQPESARGPHVDEVGARAAQRARERREAAEARVRAARDALEVASDALAARTREADAARQRREDLRQELLRMRDQVHRLERDVDEAEDSERSALGRRHDAERAQAAAAGDLERAERELKDL